MGKGRLVQDAKVKELPKTKKIEKQPPKEDCMLSMKKEMTGKQITAHFPMIRASNGNMELAVPVFRRDGRFSTPGFGLPDQFDEEYTKEQQAMHQYRVNSEVFQIPVGKIMQPKPSSRNSYCTICKVRFQDYKQHITLDEHLTKMRQSSYNEFIYEMCQSYGLRTGRYLNFCDEESDLETIDRREFLQKRKNSEQKKQRLYTELKEQLAKSTKGNSQDNEEIFDVIDILAL